MEQLMRHKDLSRCRPPEQLHGDVVDNHLLERRDPPAIEKNAHRPLPIFGKSPERAGRWIVVDSFDRHPQRVRDLLRRETGETLPHGFGCRRSVRERIADGSALCCLVKAIGMRIGRQHDKPERFRRRRDDLGQPKRSCRCRCHAYSPRDGGMAISAIGSLAINPSNSLRVMASACSIELTPERSMIWLPMMTNMSGVTTLSPL
jgi:hypothetical protein